MANTTNISTGASIAEQQQSQAFSGLTQSMFSSGVRQPDNFRPRSSIGRLQFPSDTPKYFFGVGINSYSRSSAFAFNVGLATSIILPMPKQIVDTDQVQYEQEELQSAGGAALSGMIGASGQDVAGNAKNALAAMGAAGLQAGRAIIQDLFNVNIGGATQGFTGAALNPYTTVLLKGPVYKKHDFTWTLSPRNSSESESIRKIIKELKNAMYVEAGAGYFGPPKVFSLSYYNNSNYLYKFKPCVLESMSVNYTPSSAPAFYSKTGAPDAVELRTSFLEIEFWFTGQA
jgi:hypothetical protein